MNKCYIIAAGEVEYLNFSPDETDMVICADAGIEYAEKYGIRVDLAVGDFDSYGEVPKNVKSIVHPCEKDDTDSFLAYECGKEKGYTDFVLYGVFGGRPDHTFSNYELLSAIVNDGNKAIAYGCGFRVYMIKNDCLCLPARKKGIISVFSFTDESKGVTIQGLKYQVSDFTMTNTLTRGLSNEYCGNEAKISVKDGQLLIFEQVNLVDVSAALIWSENKFLICQRPATKSNALLWEFVGGKREIGETKEQALIRECKEELDIQIKVNDEFMHVFHTYPDIDICLTLFNAEIESGEITLLEHNDYRWITVSEIDNYIFCPADKDILNELRKMK